MDSATLVIVEDRATDRRVVPVADWFFNGTADAPSEAAEAPTAKSDEKVQIGPLDV